MRNLLFFLFFFVPLLLNAQQIPVRTVTVFKNGKAMVERSGKVPVENRRYSTRTLPPALFGTYWASSASGELTRVFTALDSLETSVLKASPIDLLEKNKNQTVPCTQSAALTLGLLGKLADHGCWHVGKCACGEFKWVLLLSVTVDKIGICLIVGCGVTYRIMRQ